MFLPKYYLVILDALERSLLDVLFFVVRCNIIRDLRETKKE